MLPARPLVEGFLLGQRGLVVAAGYDHAALASSWVTLRGDLESDAAIPRGAFALEAALTGVAGIPYQPGHAAALLHPHGQRHHRGACVVASWRGCRHPMTSVDPIRSA